MAGITINGNTLEPTTRGLRLTTQPAVARAHRPTSAEEHAEAPDASKSDYVLAQTKEPLSTYQKVELANLGLVMHKYVAENTYLYGYKKRDLGVIRDLSFVQWVHVYPQHVVVAPSLKHATAPSAELTREVPRNIGDATDAPLELDVVVHRDVDANADDVKTAIASAAHVSVDSLKGNKYKVRLSLASTEHLEDIAAIDAVQLIQKVLPVGLHNNIARQILHAEAFGEATPYNGSGQVVAVADTGFDKGSTIDTHPAFSGRVRKLYALGRSNPDQSDDPNGHGTHVAGSVLGDGVSVDPLTSKLQDRSDIAGSKGGKIQGTAPKANLIFQSLLTANGALAVPRFLDNLFGPPYLNDQARVHTNSWGSEWQGYQFDYDVSSEEVDRFVWRHPDLVICFAAGNDGADTLAPGEVADGKINLGTVGQYAGAKNCIAVGASESERKEVSPVWGRWWPQDFGKHPIQGDRLADNKDGLAAFSSRGPTNSTGPLSQQRFKPDVVAPGTFILSALSRNWDGDPRKNWGTTSDPSWSWQGGTSMAAPLVAGCAAVIRESLVKNGTPSPSAALVKALLINGADEVKGQYSPSEAGKSPNNNSGWGRVNLQQSVIDPHWHPHDPRSHDDLDIGYAEGAPLKQGAQHTYPIRRPTDWHQSVGSDGRGLGGGGNHSSGHSWAGFSDFKVTLVWSDPAGEVLQNDLDLIVIGSDGSQRHGNMGTSGGFDRVNNVEQVVWPHLPPGDVTVVVTAYRITDGDDQNDGPQPYALAWRWS
ncbi:hypothetical protein LTR37_015007 [Vermiconidia calcicola]|uniref:Uncharacterized protein n=1 Tax=Vermiconidia calcicola TaxID=1690605 RepID=A0ACC3MS31_9PEZI|nr:hypothetical protein LTR37_015007 [Vermiconidia calcicola]